MNLGIFTGTSIKHPLSLKQTLRKGEDILYRFTKEFPILQSETKIRLHADNFMDNPDKKIDEKSAKILYERLKDKATIIGDKIADIIRGGRDTQKMFQSEMNYVKKMMKKYRVGNCQEISEVIYDMAKKAGLKPYLLGSLEIDHCFVVVGIKDSKDVYDLFIPSRWGNKAVVIDGWCGVVMPAKKAIQYYEEIFHMKPDIVCPIPHSNKPSKFVSGLQKVCKILKNGSISEI